MPLNADFFSNLESSDEYVEQLDERLWLMDNHKWACWIWERQLGGLADGRRAALLHFDYHFDSVNDFFNDADATAALRAENIDQIKERIELEDRIAYDSFIAPALLRGVIGDVHFFCLQDDDWDRGIDDETLQHCGSRQIFYDSVAASAQASVARPYIFDLCLDLFNNEGTKMYEGDLWPEPEIIQALNSWSHLIRDAACVTVSLSFDYSGTAEDTRYLARLVIPEMLRILHDGSGV